MRTWILIGRFGRGAKIVLKVRYSPSAEDWAHNLNRFARLLKAVDDPIVVFDIDEQEKRNGVYFRWGLAGPDGAWYEFLQTPETKPDDLKAAIAHIKRTQDVVRHSVARVRAWVDFEWEPAPVQVE